MKELAAISDIILLHGYASVTLFILHSFILDSSYRVNTKYSGQEDYYIVGN